MDFHFTLPSDSSNSSDNEYHVSRIGNFLKKLVPVFFLAALLPLFLFIISTPSDLKFLTRASRKSELRIWLEPANVVSNTGETLTLSVFANFESESKLLPAVSLVALSEGLDVDGEITYLRPFKGQVELGTITVYSGDQAGTFEVTIPEDQIEVTAFDDPLTIITSPAKLFVK